ncbi:MAG: chemotaxis protein CheW [Bacteroidales bacterium]
MAENLQEVLVFKIENQRFAIYLHSIERIIRAQAIIKLNDTPGFLEGVIDFYGEVIAVINLRKRLNFTLQEIKLNDRFIIIQTPTRKLVIIADEVENIISPKSDDIFNSKDIDIGIKFINILRDDNGIVLIYSVEDLIEKAEEFELNKFISDNFLVKNNL